MTKKPIIKEITAKKLVGKSISMSLMNNKTFDLFSDFMPKRNEISKNITEDVFEILLYDKYYFKNFNPNNEFTKWACLEVSDFENAPESMKQLSVESGLYAVFTYVGLAKDIGTLMTYIYSDWLPKSEYELDDRPHFNILGEKYKNNHVDSEETVWIPIKPCFKD